MISLFIKPNKYKIAADDVCGYCIKERYTLLPVWVDHEYSLSFTTKKEAKEYKEFLTLK